MIYIAVGRNTHAIVSPAGETEIPNSREGLVEAVCQAAGGTVNFVGNRQWAIAMASALQKAGCDIRFIAVETKKDQRQSMLAVARAFCAKGTVGRPFFGEKRPQPTRTQPMVQSPGWEELAGQYLQLTNDVREGKHRVLSCLSVLFPEAIQASLQERKKGRPIPQPMPPGIWTKKMSGVLANPDPFVLESDPGVPAVIHELAQKSLGREIQPDMKAEYMTRYIRHRGELQTAERQKQIVFDQLQRMVGNHPLARAFPNSDSAVVLTGLIGWRNWPQWRELRAYCGLSLTRMDTKGNSQISRVRPNVRQYLYLLVTRTQVGKSFAATVRQELDDRGYKGRGRRVKILEKFLKDLWRKYLK